MLAEVTAWLVTPCQFDHRRLGYLGAAISLWARGNRCRRDWSAHEAAAKSAILDAAGALPVRRTCLVLGSGLLRDVPLDRLAAMFETVVLADVVHLWPARLRARRHRNVRLLETDLTGTSQLLLGRATGFADPFVRLAQLPDLDLVVSATCLSQLPLGPAAIDARRARGSGRLPPDHGRRIVTAHLEGILRLPGRICLITDTHVETRDSAGRTTEREDLLEGVALPTPDRRWDWPVAPFGEYSRDEELVHTVHAYLDYRSARQRRGGGETR